MNRLLLALCVLSMAACSSLDSFVFDPKQEDYHFSTAVIPASNATVIELRVGSRKVYGVHAFHTPASSAKMLYFHGNYQSLNYYFNRIEMYWELGFDVFAIDYEGYGKSEGTPSEAAILDDAAAAFQVATGSLGWRASDIVIYGFSLGSVPAVDQSAWHACRLLFLEAPIGDADSIADGGSPLDVPGGFVAVSSYDNIARIRSSQNRLIVIQGTADRKLPWEQSGKRVYDAATVEKRCRWLPGVDHGDIPGQIGRETYKSLLMELMAGW
jgi:hypothetical protein